MNGWAAGAPGLPFSEPGCATCCGRWTRPASERCRPMPSMATPWTRRCTPFQPHLAIRSAQAHRGAAGLHRGVRRPVPETGRLPAAHRIPGSASRPGQQVDPVITVVPEFLKRTGLTCKLGELQRFDLAELPLPRRTCATAACCWRTWCWTSARTGPGTLVRLAAFIRLWRALSMPGGGYSFAQLRRHLRRPSAALPRCGCRVHPPARCPTSASSVSAAAADRRRLCRLGRQRPAGAGGARRRCWAVELPVAACGAGTEISPPIPEFVKLLQQIFDPLSRWRGSTRGTRPTPGTRVPTCRAGRRGPGEDLRLQLGMSRSTCSRPMSA